jgi:hypothetical protein
MVRSRPEAAMAAETNSAQSALGKTMQPALPTASLCQAPTLENSAVLRSIDGFTLEQGNVAVEQLQ